MGVAPDFGTEVNGGEDSGGVDPNIVENVGAEGGDKGERMGVKVRDAGDVAEEVLFDKLLLWNPKFLAMIVNDGVLVRVAVDGEGASGGGEEIGKDVS